MSRNAKTICLATASGLAIVTGLAASALAQDSEPTRRERIVVTAEKRAADVQSVPIAVTAITGEDLSNKQIESFRDLQFNVPSVTFTKGNFAGNNFQIRGIGTLAVALSGDAGIAVHTNNIFANSTVGLAIAEYYDVERLEVLRGPQSTLYGRNATGGAVNIITNKADLAEFATSVEGEYGEFGTKRVRGMVNIPLVEDTLAVRVAGIIAQHDGFVKNIHTNNDVDDQNVWSLRGTVTWEPWDGGRIDFVGGYFHEDDTHVRSPKQMCHRDPTGVMGCLPDRLGFDAVNGNSTLGAIFASAQGLGYFFIPPFGTLFDLSVGPGIGATAVVPDDLNTISTDFEPRFRAQGMGFQANLEQEIGDWLIANLDLGYNKGKSWSQQNYNQVVGDNISFAVASAVGFWNAFFPSFAPYDALYFSSAPSADCPLGGDFCLPISNTNFNGVGGGATVGRHILGYRDNIYAYDQIDGTGSDQSAELRFRSTFDGPLNFLVGAYYLQAESDAEYFVAADLLDFASIILGHWIDTVLSPGVCPGPCTFSPPYYRNLTSKYTLDSSAYFGEAYWDVVPDELKVTVGLRYTKDEKKTIGQTTLFNTLAPFFTEDMNPVLVAAGFDADPSQPGAQLFAVQEATFDATTGRLVVDWKPELDFTEETLLYASYAHGFRSGGMNPPLSSGLAGVPQFFAPETVDAYEIGTKNTLGFMDDGVMTANITAWYYDYQDYQVSKIFNRTSVNENIGATLWGVEGEFVFIPSDNWQFHLTATHTQSKIGEAFSVDIRNVGAGLANATVIKDITNAAQCVLLKVSGGPLLSPADMGKAGFFNPPGGSTAIAGAGVPFVNFGSSSTGNILGTPVCNDLARFGPGGTDPDFRYPINPETGLPDPSGVFVSLKGNELPLTPNNTIGVGGQYIHPIASGLDIAFRLDYYWQTETWTRIFNRDPIDKVDAWGVMNAQVQLTSEDGWHVKFFATNLLDDREITGAYLTDQSSGLFTNVFVTDPRIIGLSVGAEF